MHFKKSRTMIMEPIIPEPKTGISRIIYAGKYSLEGLKHAIKNEAAFKQEFIVNLIIQPLGWLLPFSIEMKVILSILGLGVLVVELLNSSIEACVDLISPDYHHLAKIAKDMGSLAVLISFTMLVISWAAALYTLTLN